MASKAGNKVTPALPKGDPTPPVSLENALHAGIGARARVTTASSTTLEGTVYTADPLTNLLVLYSSSTTTSISPTTFTAPTGSYHLIPIPQIRDFTLLSLPPSNSPSSTSSPPQPPPLDTTALSSRLTHAITSAQTAQSRLGPSSTTTPADQALFDTLTKSLQGHWDGTAMVIADTYVIEKPYRKDNVRLTDSAKGWGGKELERFRNRVEMERVKIDLKMGGQGQGQGQKKGG